MSRHALARSRRPSAFGVLVAGCVAVALVLLALVDYVLLDRRLGEVDVATTHGSGETWVVVGSDSRADVPADRDTYGTVEEVPGRRADVVLVVHEAAGRTSILSLPRDLLVSPGARSSTRLALTLEQPQMLVDSLCHGLGIPTDHLVVVDMGGFARVVDALGGVTVTVPRPVTDAGSGLDLAAGTHRLSGTQALALTRSRHPRELVDGAWVGTTEAAGAVDRTAWAGAVFRAALARAADVRRDPLRVQRVAWAAGAAVEVDPGTDLADLVRMWPADAPVTAVPADEVPGTYVARHTPETSAALSAAGFAPGGCA